MDVLDRINELLDSDETDTAPTSMRLPKALREAAALAVSELGAASSATALTAQALRGVLEGIVMQAALEAHFAQYPFCAAESRGISRCSGRPRRAPACDQT